MEKIVEKRALGLVGASGDPGAYRVEGYATTFGEPYEMGGGLQEAISPRALDGADMGDVILNVNHGGIPVARMSNGTLRLSRDAHGLRVEAELGGCAAGRELYEAVASGLVTKMSWAFTVADGGWEYDEATRTSTVTRIERVYDVSAVSIPANGGTEMHARSYIDAVGAGLADRAGDGEEERARAAALLTIL